LELTNPTLGRFPTDEMLEALMCLAPDFSLDTKVTLGFCFPGVEDIAELLEVTDLPL
jgi:hypothetical protein